VDLQFICKSPLKNQGQKNEINVTKLLKHKGKDDREI
jgi:hypothetical protein